MANWENQSKRYLGTDTFLKRADWLLWIDTFFKAQTTVPHFGLMVMIICSVDCRWRVWGWLNCSKKHRSLSMQILTMVSLKKRGRKQSWPLGFSRSSMRGESVAFSFTGMGVSLRCVWPFPPFKIVVSIWKIKEPMACFYVPNFTFLLAICVFCFQLAWSWRLLDFSVLLSHLFCSFNSFSWEIFFASSYGLSLSGIRASRSFLSSFSYLSSFLLFLCASSLAWKKVKEPAGTKQDHKHLTNWTTGKGKWMFVSQAYRRVGGMVHSADIGRGVIGVIDISLIVMWDAFQQPSFINLLPKWASSIKCYCFSEFYSPHTWISHLIFPYSPWHVNFLQLVLKIRSQQSYNSVVKHEASGFWHACEHIVGVFACKTNSSYLQGLSNE